MNIVVNPQWNSKNPAQQGPTLPRRRRHQYSPSLFARPLLGVFALLYTYYCDFNTSYWSVYNNDEVLTKGLFRGSADWDNFKTFYFNRSHVALSPKEFFLEDTFVVNDQHGYFDNACAAHPSACSNASGEAFGSDVVACMLMSGSKTKFIHDACWWSSTSGSAFIIYAYVDAAQQASLAGGGVNTDYMKFVYEFDGNVDFHAELVRGTYESATKTVPSGIPTTSVSHAFRGQPVSLSDCTNDEPKDFCSAVRAYLDQSGNIVPKSYVKHFEYKGELIAIVPHFDEECVYSVVQSQNLFMDNLGLDGVGTGTRPWANPLIYGRYRASCGGFRYGYLIQVIILELLAAFRACIAHPRLPHNWAVVMSGLSSHTLVVIQMLGFYWYWEIYYVRNTVYNFMAGGAERWVYGLIFCQCIEILYVVLSLEPFVMQYFYGNRDCTNLKGKQVVAYGACVSSVLAVILTLTGNNTSAEARTSIRSSTCPGKAVSCGWRDWTSFHVIVVLYVLLGIIVQAYHSQCTYKRQFKRPTENSSTFERFCLGFDCNAFSGQRISSRIDGSAAFPVHALCGFGFTYARNGDLIRTKDVLYYAWLMKRTKHFDISVVMWMSSEQGVRGKLEPGLRITRRSRSKDQPNVQWLG